MTSDPESGPAPVENRGDAADARKPASAVAPTKRPDRRRWALIAAGVALPLLLVLFGSREDPDRSDPGQPVPAPSATEQANAPGPAASSAGAPAAPSPSAELRILAQCERSHDVMQRANAVLHCRNDGWATSGKQLCMGLLRNSADCADEWEAVVACAERGIPSLWRCDGDSLGMIPNACASEVFAVRQCVRRGGTGPESRQGAAK